VGVVRCKSPGTEHADSRLRGNDAVWVWMARSKGLLIRPSATFDPQIAPPERFAG